MEEKKVYSSFSLTVDALPKLIESTKDWALSNGAGMRSKSNYSVDSVNFIPFTLFPSTFPKNEFEKVKSIQLILNELIHNVAHDYEFLKSTLKNTVEVDDFTKNLFNIYELVYNEGCAQSYSLGLLRSDYMLDDKNEKLSVKQVEINTIASSFGGLSPKISLLHRFVLERQKCYDEIKQLPENLAVNGLCEGLVEAWQVYGNTEAIILMVVEDTPYNICDQRLHEFEIYRINPRITVHRKTLSDLSKSGKLNQDKKIFVDDKEVAVVYYRAGYSPDQYHSENEWNIRLLIERSKAIKCPSIHYHLAGTKKIQQALACEYVLTKFLNDSTKVKAVKDVFTGLYSLDLNAAGDKAVEMALINPNNFVLKPQREGGGNNVYGDDIPKLLAEIGNSNERTAWILMDYIRPPVQLNYIIRPGCNDFSVARVLSELGIFGVILGKKNEIILNKQLGHLLRTKEHSVKEGGIAFGAGSLDSPFLC